MPEDSTRGLIEAARSSLDEAAGHEARVEHDERADYLVERSQAEAILAIAISLERMERSIAALGSNGRDRATWDDPSGR